MAEQLVQEAPRSSMAQGRLAIASIWAASDTDPGTRERLLQQARHAAEAALRIDPDNDEALTAMAEVMSLNQTRAAEERVALAYLRRAPLSADLNFRYGFFLRETGRIQESIAYFRRAAARKPLSVYYVGILGWTLATAGSDREARVLLEQAWSRWPGDEDIWWANFRTSLWFGSRNDALRLLDEAPRAHSTEEVACWRRVVQGLAAVRHSAIADARNCLGQADLEAQLAVALGDMDAAFEAADRVADSNNRNAFVFFYPAMSAMRRDRRFMPLMQRFGLVDYWLESDHWPDFCHEPSLDYDCRVEARRLNQVR